MLNKPALLFGGMIYAGLTTDILWLSLSLLLLSALARMEWIGVAGWLLFAIYWTSQIGHYIGIDDYFNSILAMGAAFFCIAMAWMVQKRGFATSSCLWASYAAAICGILYFPFAEIQVLNSWLIGETAILTANLLALLNIPVAMVSWNTLAINDRSVEIVLACTAIESIALFAGIILSVAAPKSRRIFAVALSTSAIYILNIVRNAFVLLAYGEQWFGEESFYLAHNVIAKIGSTFALLIIAYAVFSILPELLKLIDDFTREIRQPGRGMA
ncbi:MAG: archaeosortase A [Methanotrichaceae archaeon]|nr:archaeosortase A [Methanotrichaceae archaeon]